MKVHLVRKETIAEFMKNNSASRVPFTEFLVKLKFANWEEPNDIKLTFNSADLLPKACDRVVLDIGGNNYRMICGYKFRKKEVYLYINWIGTHAEYSKICNNSEQYTISLY